MSCTPSDRYDGLTAWDMTQTYGAHRRKDFCTFVRRNERLLRVFIFAWLRRLERIGGCPVIVEKPEWEGRAMQIGSGYLRIGARPGGNAAKLAQAGYGRRNGRLDRIPGV